MKPSFVWVVCDAPPGGCGGGRRKRIRQPANKLYCHPCCGASVPLGSGWYYWFCFPGCLPEGEPFGPYDSEEETVEAARDEASE